MSDFFFPPRIIWLRYAPPREGGEPAWRFSGGASQATGEQITTPCCYSSPARRRSVLNCVSHAGGRLQPGCFCGTERGASQGGRSRFRQIRDVRLPTACVPAAVCFRLLRAAAAAAVRAFPRARLRKRTVEWFACGRRRWDSRLGLERVFIDADATIEHVEYLGCSPRLLSRTRIPPPLYHH